MFYGILSQFLYENFWVRKFACVNKLLLEEYKILSFYLFDSLTVWLSEGPKSV